MSFVAILFYIFAAVLLGAAFKVVTARNPVHAVLFLVLAFATSACLWMLIQAEFLAIILVLVYVGAVLVFFLFVVMMLNINIERMRSGFWKNLPVALIVAAIIGAELILVLSHPQAELGIALGEGAAQANNAKTLGMALYTDYLLPVELAAILLVLAMVAAITLSHRPPRTKYMNPAEQVKVKASERWRLVKMQAEVDEPVIDEKQIDSNTESSVLSDEEKKQ